MPSTSQARIGLSDLIEAGLLQVGEKLVYDDHFATLLPDGDLYVGEPGTIPPYLQITYQSLSSWCSGANFTSCLINIFENFLWNSLGLKLSMVC
jgi:hypothetical protein